MPSTDEYPTISHALSNPGQAFLTWWIHDAFLTCDEAMFSRSCRMEPMQVLETVKDNIEMASREQIGGGHKIVTPMLLPWIASSENLSRECNSPWVITYSGIIFQGVFQTHNFFKLNLDMERSLKESTGFNGGSDDDCWLNTTALKCSRERIVIS